MYSHAESGIQIYASFFTNATLNYFFLFFCCNSISFPMYPFQPVAPFRYARARSTGQNLARGTQSKIQDTKFKGCMNCHRLLTPLQMHSDKRFQTSSRLRFRKPFPEGQQIHKTLSNYFLKSLPTSKFGSKGQSRSLAGTSGQRCRGCASGRC